MKKDKQGKSLALGLCDCNTKCRLLLVRYSHAILFTRIYEKDKFITPLPLMFPW